MQNKSDFTSRKILIGFVAVTLCLLSSTAALCKTPEEAAYERAQALKRSSDFDQSAKILLQLYRKHPQNVALLVELGEAYLNDDNEMAGGQLKAEQCFSKAIKIDPQYGKAYYMMTEWANAQSKYDLAIKMATKALTVKKPDYQAYMERAASYSRLHRDKDALADLDKFISMGGAKRNAYERRASILENLHQYERAHADYLTMQKLHYDDGTALKDASCLEKLNKNEEAITCLTNLLKRNPEDDAGYEARGRMHVKLGRLKEAVADYTRAIQLIPSPTIYKERAAAYEKMGRKDLAAQDRKEAERI
jgi:tetratricopeptide (TPR) repeat protein